MANRAKRRNFSNTKIETLVNEFQLKKMYFLANLGQKKKKLAAWEKMTDAVNSVGSEERTLSEKNEMV